MSQVPGARPASRARMPVFEGEREVIFVSPPRMRHLRHRWACKSLEADFSRKFPAFVANVASHFGCCAREKLAAAVCILGRPPCDICGRIMPLIPLPYVF